MKIRSMSQATAAAVFIVICMMLIGINSTMAQVDTNLNKPGVPTQINKVPPVAPYPTDPKKVPMDIPPDHTKTMPADTSNHITPKTGTRHALTDADIRKIVGNDQEAGKDGMGHQLYKDSNGRKYYVADDGNKIYVK